MLRQLLFIEKVCLVLTLFGWITSIWLWSSSYAFFLLGLMGLIVVYAGFYWKLSGVKPLSLELLKGLLLASVLIGIGYTWMMWEINDWFFTGSLMGLMSIFFTKDVRKLWKKRMRLWIVFLCGIVFWFLTPLNVVQIKYFQHPQYINAVEEYYTNPSEKNAMKVDSLNQAMLKKVISTPVD